MRASIDFTVTAQTVGEIKEKALSEWKRIMENQDAEFPPSTELRMQQESEGSKTYTAHVIVQTKLGE
jgi:hypothetical protein